MEQGDSLSEEVKETRSTEPAEDVLKEYMTEEKRQALLVKLQGLKANLDQLEAAKNKMAQPEHEIDLFDEDYEDGEESEEELNGEALFNRVELISLITTDLRNNMQATGNFSNSGYAYASAIAALNKATQIYNDILDLLIKSK
jgi:hypothetical protein